MQGGMKRGRVLERIVKKKKNNWMMSCCLRMMRLPRLWQMRWCSQYLETVEE